MASWKFWLQSILLAVPVICVASFVVTSFNWPLVGDTVLMRYVVFLIQHGFAPYRQIIEMNMPGSYFAEYLAMHLFGAGAHGARLFDFSLLAATALAMLAIVRRIPLSFPLDTPSVPDPDFPSTSALAPGFTYAALFAAAMFAILHAGDGLAQANQRDLTVAVLWLAAIAFLFASLRIPQSPLATAASPESAPAASPQSRTSLLTLTYAAAFGICASASITLKPTAAPFLLVFLIAGAFRAAGFHTAAFRSHTLAASRDRAASTFTASWLSAALAGAALPLLATLLYLAHTHSLAAFYDTIRYLDREHSRLSAPTFYLVLGAMVPAFLRPVLLVWIATAIALRRWRPFAARWHYACLLGAVALGLVSYLLQWKGFPYHRYPALAFALLVCAIDFTAALRRRSGWIPVLGTLGLGLLAITVAPRALIHADSYDNRPEVYLDAMQADVIAAADGPAPNSAPTSAPASAPASASSPTESRLANLSGHIQCLDMSAGCVNTLYNLHLVSSTGMFYDCFLFNPQQSAYTLQLRQQFLGEMRAAPPQVIVLTSQLCFKGPHGFNKVDNWPEFAAYLGDHYSIAVERTPEPYARNWDPPEMPFSYRIYKLKSAN